MVGDDSRRSIGVVSRSSPSASIGNHHDSGGISGISQAVLAIPVRLLDALLRLVLEQAVRLVVVVLLALDAVEAALVAVVAPAVLERAALLLLQVGAQRLDFLLERALRLVDLLEVVDGGGRQELDFRLDLADAEVVGRVLGQWRRRRGHVVHVVRHAVVGVVREGEHAGRWRAWCWNGSAGWRRWRRRDV